jgi:small-conductance mechanosensitive channel
MMDAFSVEQSLHGSINQLIDEQDDAQSMLDRLTKAIRSSNQATAIDQSTSVEQFEALARSFTQASNRQAQWKNEAMRAKYMVLPLLQTVLSKLDGADKRLKQDDERLREIVRSAHVSVILRINSLCVTVYAVTDTCLFGC